MKYELLEKSQVIRNEAKEILKASNIEQELAKFGQVNLIGSYKYNVMLDKDIDFHVVVDEFNADLVTNFFDYAFNCSLFEYISFHDKHKFNKDAAERYAAKKALDSYYFGLRLVYNSHGWQIGVNFITEPQPASVEIVNLFEDATDAQREQILVFKHMISESGLKMSSSYLYRAVIEKKIDNKDDLFAYLESIGYKL